MAKLIVISEAERPYYLGYLADLKKAYFSGASRVKYRDRDTTFRSKEEMKGIIDELEGSLNPVEVARSGSSLGEFNTGL